MGSEAKNILTLIQEDHAAFCEVLGRVEACRRSGGSSDLLEKLKEDLRGHGAAEEAIFYSRLPEPQRIADVKVHSDIGSLLDRMDAVSSETDHRRNLEMLRLCLIDHFLMEERVYFPWLRKLFSEEKLQFLGELFVELRGERSSEAAPGRAA